MRTASCVIVLASAAAICAAPAGVEFVPSAERVECYDFVEVTVNVDRPHVTNPFTEASVQGHSVRAGGEPVKVDGFCDGVDGRVFRIRFMPTRPGEHTYAVVYRQGTYEAAHTGKFTAREAGRRGLIRVDKEHPWHFLWEGTAEHYFWNGTTTYWLLGWDDETIRSSIDRLAGLKVNRLRVAINGRGDGSMTMLEGYGHIVDFFTALPWWRLEPDNDFFESRRIAAVGTEWAHVVYTRDREGKAVLYVDGKPVSTSQVGGDPSNWDDDFRLALGNELTGDRPWRGALRRVALYARALDPDEVARFAKAGRDKAPAGPVVLYAFGEGTGQVVRDTSCTGAPLNLQVRNASTVQWLDGGGLRIIGSALIASSEPATKLIEAVKRSKAMTIEAWIKPANITQAGPARIVTLSKDASGRNFTLGQKTDAYEVRFRTTVTSPNGEPAVSSPGGDEAIPAVAGLRSPSGDLAVLYFSSGGAARIRQNSRVAGPRARWFNPRTGQWSSAEPDENGDYVAPDGQDWTLLMNEGQKAGPSHRTASE